TPLSTRFPSTTLFRSRLSRGCVSGCEGVCRQEAAPARGGCQAAVRDAARLSPRRAGSAESRAGRGGADAERTGCVVHGFPEQRRSEEHTSELQSREKL